MPHTVPNRPTNGAVEPTVARNARPSGQLAVHRVDRTLQRHGDPLVQVDAVGQAAFMVGGGAQAVFGDGAEVVVLLEALDAVLEGRSSRTASRRPWRLP